MKLIHGRPTFIPGFCVFVLHPNRSGVSPHSSTIDYTPPHHVRRKGSASASAHPSTIPLARPTHDG